MSYILVFCGGGLGAVLRYMVTSAVTLRLGSNFPHGTLSVNVLGSFLIGIIMGVLMMAVPKGAGISEEARLFLVVGVLGGFTTFSSFSLETLTLLRTGQMLLGAVNVVVNCLLGIVAAYAGWYLTKVL